MTNGHRTYYLDWLQEVHEGAHGNSDLVAHFLRRAFGLLRPGGCLGLVATNTIGQGDTRRSGLQAVIGFGGTVIRAIRRLPWPGEAAVTVIVVHVLRGPGRSPILDGRQVRRISAYLVEGELDGGPVSLAANAGSAFQGMILLGMGFTFDDEAAAKRKASPLSEMHRLIAKDTRNAERSFRTLGGEEVTATCVMQTGDGQSTSAISPCAARRRRRHGRPWTRGSGHDADRQEESRTTILIQWRRTGRTC